MANNIQIEQKKGKQTVIYINGQRFSGIDKMDSTYIYNMELHSTDRIGGKKKELGDAFCSNVNGFILRVPGGWIYTIVENEIQPATSTFVPYNSEFQPNGDKR